MESKQTNQVYQLYAIVLLPLLLFLTSISISCNRSESESESGTTPGTEELDGPTRDFVFNEGNKDFAQCHASTVAQLNNGSYIVAWFGGSHEKHDDVGIWISKGEPGNWSDPIELEKLREDPHWNPVLFTAPDGKVILYFKVGKEIPTWETWYTVSDDNGTTWSEAKELVPGDRGGRGPVKNKPIILSNGDWLAPASHEEGQWDSFVDISKDGGKTWKASEYIPMDRKKYEGKGSIQPTLWESEPGHVHMLVRTSEGFIGRSDSDDYGVTWSELYETSLPNPNSGIDLVKLEDGALVLAYNPDDKNWGDRAPLTLAVSEDNGKTWPYKHDIETGVPDDEFSYPSIISAGRDKVAAVYTWQREKVAFWEGTVDQIKNLSKENQ
ncbi:sialidase family protein [Membranihabitans maritimus]|uniref:sialidase family protein n=1 Tax=Membranihabitans maritimus TaxID=2904244 RepID=UPI001F424DDF|nr:sialidase family protein [Membranihabitans maritimus]